MDQIYVTTFYMKRYTAMREIYIRNIAIYVKYHAKIIL